MVNTNEVLETLNKEIAEQDEVIASWEKGFNEEGSLYTMAKLKENVGIKLGLEIALNKVKKALGLKD